MEDRKKRLMNYDWIVHQKWLINRMQALGYTADNDGVCYGTAWMAFLACQAGELEKFDKRLEVMFEIPVKDFAASIENVKQKYLAIVKKIKDENSNPQISQQLIQDEVNKLPLNERLLLDVPAFFDGVELFFRGQKYPHLFEEGKIPANQNFISNSMLTLPVKLQSSNNINESLIKIKEFSGIYNYAELKRYFESFDETIKKMQIKKNPISMVLIFPTHALTLSFDQNTNIWNIVDPNFLPSYPTSNIDTLVKHVLKASLEKINFVNQDLVLPPNMNATFSTHICTTKAFESEISSLSEAWTNSNSMIELHEVTQERANRQDQSGISWIFKATVMGDDALVAKLIPDKEKLDPKVESLLYVAAEHGLARIIKILLDKGADPKVARANQTPLFIASWKGHLDAVETLLKSKKVNINGAMKDLTFNPLVAAASQGHSHIVKKLLKYGADLRNQNVGILALSIASEKGYTEVVREILKYNKKYKVIDINHSMHNKKIETERFGLKAQPDIYLSKENIPLVAIAILKGHINIVKMLLENNINTIKTFKLPNRYLIDWATKNNCVDKIERFIAERSPNRFTKLFISSQNTELNITELVNLLGYQEALQKITNTNPNI